MFNVYDENPKVGSIVIFDIWTTFVSDEDTILNLGTIIKMDYDINGENPGWCLIKQPSGRIRARNYKKDIDDRKMFTINEDDIILHRFINSLEKILIK